MAGRVAPSSHIFGVSLGLIVLGQIDWLWPTSGGPFVDEVQLLDLTYSKSADSVDIDPEYLTVVADQDLHMIRSGDVLHLNCHGDISR